MNQYVVSINSPKQEKVFLSLIKEANIKAEKKREKKTRIIKGNTKLSPVMFAGAWTENDDIENPREWQRDYTW